MRSGASRHIGCVPGSRMCRLAAGLALALLAAGCTTDGAPAPLASTAAPPGRGATIAFESVDGLPPRLYEATVATLAEEATARRIQVVSRTVPAEYRIRIYLAAHAEGRQARVAWVWDVYDAGKRRALRIDGDEAGERKAGDIWSAVDDAMLRRIARASLDRLVSFLEMGPPPQQEAPEAVPTQDGAPVAAVSVPDSLALAVQPR
jgi:hypothetical protein